MKPAHVARLEVRLDGASVGTLARDKAGVIYFAYTPEWTKNGFALSPLGGFQNGDRSWPTAAFPAKNREFQGLHGVFNDALPDGWGLLLMDRAFGANPGWARHEITPLDRLAYMGNRAMGALEFYPLMVPPVDSGNLSLAELAEAAMAVEEGSPGEVASSLLLQGGSPGGARPKVTLAVNEDWTHCVSGFDSTPENYDHWIVKFRAKDHDPEGMGLVEKTYAEMAGHAGIIMPETRLVRVTLKGRNTDLFAVKRFDREGDRKKHVLTLGGLVDANHRVPSMSYGAVLEAVAFVTRDAREVEKAFRLMLFNMFAHNKDDHIKNFSFILDNAGWVLSPAYDLTFSTGMNNQHMTDLEGGQRITAVGALAGKHGIGHWKEIVDEVREAVSRWPEIAGRFGVDRQVIKDYGRAMNEVPLKNERPGARV